MVGALLKRLPFKGDRHPSIQASAAWAKPHEPPAARIYCRSPTKIYLWQVFLSFSQGIGLCLLGRDVKDHYNILVSDRGRGPSPNLPLIFGVTGLCLDETGLHAGALADPLHPAHVIIRIHSSPLILCAPLEAHLLSDSPISTAIKRINISILGHVEMKG